MNGTLISEETTKELKDLAKDAEILTKKVKDLETDILFGDKSDHTFLMLRVNTEMLTELTEQLTELIKNL
jgi:chlorite dismutase